MKRALRIGLLALFASTLLAPTSQAAVSAGVGISTNGLVMYWDAANPYSYSGSGNSWNDLSGNNYGATLVGSPTNSHLNTGSYFTFNGSAQYATVGDNTIDFSGGYSVSFYANFGSVANNWERILDFGNGAALNNFLVGREGGTNNLWFEVHNNGSGKGACRGTSAIGSNTVDQYTLIVSSNGSSCGIYKNGAYFATSIASGTDFRPNSGVTRSNNFIGESNWAGDDFFEGKIYDLAIYNRPLDANEIAQNFTAMTDGAWPTISAINYSMAENKTAVDTITASGTATFTNIGGDDSAKFSLSGSGVISFITAPNFEVATDGNRDNVYLLNIRVMDNNGNYNSGTLFITVTNVAEVASLSTPTFSGTPYKGRTLTITVTPSAGNTAGRINFLIANKRIPGCYKKVYSGSGSSTCTFDPSITGNREIAITFTPNGTEYGPVTVKQSLWILKRTTTR